MKLGLLVTCMMLTTSVYASPVKYTCEDSKTPQGIVSSWEAVLDLNYNSGNLESFKFKGETLKKFEVNNSFLILYNDSINKGDALAVGVFQTKVNVENTSKFSVLIMLGRSNDAASGDVIIFSPAFGLSSYHCYKQGSKKDKLTSALREEHNERVTGQ